MTFTRSITKNTKLVLILYYRKGNTTIERSDFAQYYGLEPKANEEKLKILEWRHCHFFSVETFIEKKMVDTIDELHVEKLLAKSLPCFLYFKSMPNGTISISRPPENREVFIKASLLFAGWPFLSKQINYWSIIDHTGHLVVEKTVDHEIIEENLVEMGPLTVCRVALLKGGGERLEKGYFSAFGKKRSTSKSDYKDWPPPMW